MTNLTAIIENGSAIAYLRPVASNTATRIYDVEIGSLTGRIILREDNPGWFVAWDGLGVIRTGETVRYFVTPELAFDTMVSGACR